MLDGHPSLNGSKWRDQADYSDSKKKISGNLRRRVTRNAPPITWQTYDIIFRSVRMNGSRMESPAYLTAFHNGLVIHNNFHLQGVTGEAIDSRIEKPGHLRRLTWLAKRSGQ